MCNWLYFPFLNPEHTPDVIPNSKIMLRISALNLGKWEIIVIEITSKVTN